MFGFFKRRKNTPEETGESANVSTPAVASDGLSEPPAPAPSPSYPPMAWGHTHVGPAEEFKATAGEPLPEGAAVASESAVVDALRTVYDPEIPVNIYDLGLIYRTDIAASGDIAIEMSLTAPGCPVAGEMPGMVAKAVSQVEGTGRIDVTIVWEPAWTPERMSEDAKLALGMD